MDMNAILTQMAVLFIILAVGYIANKVNVLPIAASRMLSKLVMHVTLPCLVLHSVMTGDLSLSGGDAAFFLLMSLLVYAIGFLISIVVPLLLRVPRPDRGLYRFMTAFANVGFMGFPVVEAIFGSSAAFYVALFNLPFGMLAFSIGIMMIAGKGEKINPKLFINPTLIASIAAFVIFALQLRIPTLIVDATDLIGRVTTPAAMLIIGSTLAGIPFREVFSEWRVYPFALIKLIVIPAVTCLAIRNLVPDSLMLGVLVIMAAMPSATNTTMMSMEYGGNERLASIGVFLTTILSLVTVPLIVFLMLK